MNQDIQYLIDKNWKIFPCGKNKAPLTKNGFYDATTDINIISKWNNNIGVATGKTNRITVLDIDPRHGGHISIKEFDVPDTPYVETGGGGRHYYFKYTEKAKTGANIIAQGLDIRNDGAYVIAPPSVHKSGKAYVWCDEDLPLAEAPSWLLSTEFEKEIKKFKITEGQIPQGEQDDYLFRYACSLREKKLTPGMIADTLRGVIGNQQRCPQDQKNPFTEKDVERWIMGAFKNVKMDEEKKRPDAIIYLNPINSLDFKQKDVPPIEFYVDGLLQKRGRTMISAKSNMGKSFFLLHMLATLCKGEEKFLDQFENDLSKPNVLYLDLEMGESALQERLLLMGETTELPNLYVQSMYGWNMMDKVYQTALENIISEKDIKIIAFDPLGSLWLGNENDRSEVKKLTDYFDYLLDKYGVSVCITHHWRKATKDFKEGGEMAAGSYGWNKWLDNHITLRGEISSLIMNCDKIRNQKKWGQVRLSLNEETFLFNSHGEFAHKKKFSDEDMLGIFNSFRKTTVTVPEFIKKGKDVCSRTTLYRMLEDSKYLRINKIRKPHILYRLNTQEEMEL